MNKYKIVGILNFVFGSFQIVNHLVTIFFIIPRIATLYSEVAAVSPPLGSAYFSSGISLLLSALNLFFGFKLFSKQKETQAKYFKVGLIFVSLRFLVWAFLRV